MQIIPISQAPKVVHSNHPIDGNLHFLCASIPFSCSGRKLCEARSTWVVGGTHPLAPSHSQLREMRRILSSHRLHCSHTHTCSQCSVWLHFGRRAGRLVSGVAFTFSLNALIAVVTRARSVACTLGLAQIMRLICCRCTTFYNVEYLSAVAFPWAERLMQRGQPRVALRA